MFKYFHALENPFRQDILRVGTKIAVFALFRPSDLNISRTMGFQDLYIGGNRLSRRVASYAYLYFEFCNFNLTLKFGYRQLQLQVEVQL